MGIEKEVGRQRGNVVGGGLGEGCEEEDETGDAGKREERHAGHCASCLPWWVKWMERRTWVLVL